VNELQRQQAVDKYNLLDTMPEERYDKATAIVAAICNAPYRTYIDGQRRTFIKSGHGVEFTESPDLSLYGHAILEDSIMVVKMQEKIPDFMTILMLKEMKAIFLCRSTNYRQ
jgi:hypothetical protein